MTALDLQELRNRVGGKIYDGGRRWVGPGPGHSRRDASLSVRLSDEGRVLVHSFAGDDFEACADHLGLRERESRVRQPAPARRAQPTATPDDSALKIWRDTKPGGEVVARYLQGRGITLPIPPTLRQGVDFACGLTPVPALVAAVQMPDRAVGAVQRLRLTWRGKKAPISVPRLTTGRLFGGAVRLALADEEMGIAEGVETALSAMQLFGIPVWAALGAQRLETVWLPPIVRCLTIFADADDAGQRAADKAAEAHARRGLTVKIKTPVDAGDWNDVLQAGCS